MRAGKSRPRQEIIHYLIMKHFSIIQPFAFRSKPTESHDLKVTLSESKSEGRGLPSGMYAFILNVLLKDEQPLFSPLT